VSLDLILYLSPFFVSAAISAGIGIFSLRHRAISGAKSFGIFALLQSFMTLGFIFELLSLNLEAKIFWDDVQFILLYFSPIFFLSFAVDYAGKEFQHPKRVWGILVFFPIILTILTFTNMIHGFIRSAPVLIPGEPFDALFYEFTPAIWAGGLYAYVMILTAMWFLISRFIQSQRLYRFQVGLVILGVLIPVAGSLITLLGLTPPLYRDITPLTFAIGNLIIAWALFRYQLFNLAPVARETVFINLTDFVIVIDSQSRIIDLNPAALANLEKPANEIIGKPIREIFKAYGHFFEDLSGATNLDTEIFVENDENQQKFYSLNISPLQDRQGRLVGRVVILQDISKRKQAEEEIKKHRDELEEIVEARTTGLLAANESLKQEIAERKSIEGSLRKTQQQFQDMFDNSQAIIYAKSMDGKFIFVNKEWRDRSGFGDQDFEGKTTVDLFPDYWQEIWDENEQRVLETGESSMVEEIGRITGKTYITTNFLLRDSDGIPYAMCNSAIDITDRAKAEKELQQSVQRLETLRNIDQALIAAETPESIAQTALDHVIKQIPCSYASILAYDPEINLSKKLALQSEFSEIPISQTSILFNGDEHNLQSNEISIINLSQNASHLSPLEQILLDQGIQTYIIVPLSFEHTVIGWMNLGLENSITLAQEKQEILKEVANQLAIAIQQARLNEQIRLHADTLEQRIADRTAELKAANQHLLALSNVKDEFVSNVSHELRTPITSLKLYHDLLPMQPEKLDMYLATLRRETNRLETLIEELLTLSRLDQGRVNSQLAECDLNTTIKTYLSDRSLLAAKQGINLNFIPDAELPIIEVDENLIGQVLSILLTNAINYTPPNSNVMVLTQTQQLNGEFWAGFCIQDTGPGIQPDELDQLFKRFYRGKAGRESGVPGTGLGLAIAYEIVTQHGGFIDVESEGLPGKGTSFKVWLPT